jgi:hypothetical protein
MFCAGVRCVVHTSMKLDAANLKPESFPWSGKTNAKGEDGFGKRGKSFTGYG